MSEGWRSSDESDTHKKASPWRQGETTEDESPKLVTRSGWGENLSPLAQNMKPVQIDGQDPNRNGGNGAKPWRSGFGGVSPGAQTLPVENRGDQSPFKPQNDPKPWRAGYPDSVYRGPAGTDAIPPDGGAGSWRAGYPDSVYRGPGTETQRNPSPWANPGRATYPESTYKPEASPPPPDNNATPDWRTFAQQQIQQQQQQPGRQSPFPGDLQRNGAPPGVVANPGLNNITADQRQHIENSLQHRTSISGYLGTGAITGGLIGAGEWALDKKLLATVGHPQTGFMGWWEKQSPLMKAQQGYASRLAESEAVHATRVAEAATASGALAESAQKVRTLLSGIDASVAADDVLKGIVANTQAAGKDGARIMAESLGALDPAQKLLLRQQSWVANAANVTNPKNVAAVIGTHAEVEAGKKLFVTGSTQAVELTQFANLSAANTRAVGAVKLAETEMDRSRAMLQDSVEGGPGSLAGRSFNGAVKGLAIAGGTLAAGYALDKLGSNIFGYKAPETDGMGRFLLDGVAVPAVLMSNLPSRYKFGLAATAFVGARLGDYFAGTGASTSMSTLLRPNIADGVLITGAAMAPVDGRTKALLVGGAYALGRVYNGVARLTGLDGGHPTELRDNAVNSFSHDQLSKSQSSFESAVEKGVKLGKENEAALELQMRDWLAKQSTTNPVSHMRGTAVIAAALGQFRLEEGSRFDLTSHGDKKERILKGYNFDFGGEATTWLRMAAGSLVAAQNFAINNKGKVVDGQTMDDAYIQQLKNHQQKVEAKLNQIYGAHDVKAVYEVLKKQARVNSGDMQQALVRLKNQFDVIASNDTRFVAKSARDLAIGYLAEASYMAGQKNGEEARVMHMAAVKYLEHAFRIDPNNPDNKALNDLQREVAQGVPGASPSIPEAIDKQYKSNWNNPFQLPTPNYPGYELPRK